VRIREFEREGADEMELDDEPTEAVAAGRTGRADNEDDGTREERCERVRAMWWETESELRLVTFST